MSITKKLVLNPEMFLILNNTEAIFFPPKMAGISDHGHLQKSLGVITKKF